MFKFITRNYIFYSGSTSIIQSFTTAFVFLFFYFVIQNLFGNEFLGIYSLFIVYLSLFNVFSLGIGGSILRYIPLSSDKEKKLLLMSGLMLTTIINFTVVVSLYFFKNKIYNLFLDEKFEHSLYQLLFPLFLWCIFTQGYNTLFQHYLDSKELIHKRNFVIIFSNIIILIFILLIQYLTLTSYYIFLAHLLYLLLQFIFYIPSLKFDRNDFKNFGFSQTRLIISYAPKFQLLNIIIIAQDAIIKTLIASYLNLSSLGIYEFITKIFIQLKTLFSLFIFPFLPRLTKVSDYSFKSAVKISHSIYKKITSISCYLTLTVSISLIFYFSFINISENLDQIILLLCTIGFTMYLNIETLPFYYVLQSNGEIKYLNIYHFIYLSICITLFLVLKNNLKISYIYIPHFIATIFSFTYLIYKTKKISNFESIINIYSLKGLIKPILLFTSIFFIFYIIKNPFVQWFFLILIFLFSLKEIILFLIKNIKTSTKL